MLNNPLYAEHMTQSIEAEQMVLGALMWVPDAWDKCGHLLQAGDFYRAGHRVIFSAIADLMTKGHQIDSVTLKDSLRQGRLLEEAGGEQYLDDLLKSAPGSANLEAYARIITERSLYRRVVTAYTAAGDMLVDTEIPLTERALTAANRIADAITDASPESATPLVKESLQGWIEHLQSVSEAQSGIIGIPTGFTDLDKAISGMSPGELIVLAARPSMGKSALALNICANVADQGLGVYVASMEMAKPALFNRLCAAVTNSSYDAIRHADFSRPGITEATTAFVNRARDWNMALDDRARLSLDKLALSLRQHKRKHGLHLAMVDYLGLLETEDEHNRNNAVAILTRGLKVLAGELGIPILLLSQLNRELEKRTNKRPLMSDLRDSGAIEQDAHTILFLYDDGVYNPDSPSSGYTELIIGKARDAERGKVIPLLRRMEHQRFISADPESLPSNWNGGGMAASKPIAPNLGRKKTNNWQDRDSQ